MRACTFCLVGCLVGCLVAACGKPSSSGGADASTEDAQPVAAKPEPAKSGETADAPDGKGTPAGKEAPAAGPTTPSTVAEWSALGDDELAALYRAVTARLEEAPLDDAGAATLEGVAAHAKDVHLRANAWLALGSAAQDRGDVPAAVALFSRVTAALPDEPAGHAVLALALAAQEDYEAAVASQRRLVALDPDDLQAWLIWGELQVKAGQSEEAAKVYAGYEARRKGLLDGLTLQREGAYTLRPEDRAACAMALSAAPDNGTAMALLYALSSDPDPRVREALVTAMGIQRFEGYLAPLEHHLTVETDPDTKVATLRAIGEIRAQPVQTRPGPSPVDGDGGPLQPPAASAPDDAPSVKDAPATPAPDRTPEARAR